MNHFIKEKEGRQLEFKESLPNYKRLFESVVAFSNDIGGTIVIGVRDSDARIIGISESQIEKYFDEIPRAIYDAISPSCRPQIKTKKIEDRTILEIKIIQGPERPYYLKSKGIPRGVYTRIGAHNKPVNEDMFKDLENTQRRISFDEIVNTSPRIEDLDSQILKEHYRKTPTPKNLLADQVLKIDRLSGEPVLTNGGIIYFHRSPTEILKGCEVLVTIYGGNKRSNVIKSIDFSCPLPSLVLEVENFIRPYLTRNFKLNKMKLKETEWEIPYPAFREALLNALIHRKYSIPAGVKVSLFDDRVEIMSPGNFPGPLNSDEYRDGITYPRNELLRKIARKSGLVEKRGIGLELILSSADDMGTRADIIEGGDYVKVVLFRIDAKANKKAILPPEFEQFESIFRTQDFFSSSQIVDLLSVSPNTARKEINKLLDAKLVYKKGEGRATKYYWTKEEGT